MSRFLVCLPRILEHEGGWVDHVKDPGGATNKGITLATYSDWLKRKATKAELKAIPPQHVSAIYEANYWDAASCDKLPVGVDYVVFDLAVNSGPSRARKMLQQTVGTKPDGMIGPATLRAVEALGSRETIKRLCDAREAFYRALPTFQTFGKGWLNRLREVEITALGEAA